MKIILAIIIALPIIALLTYFQVTYLFYRQRKAIERALFSNDRRLR